MMPDENMWRRAVVINHNQRSGKRIIIKINVIIVKNKFMEDFGSHIHYAELKGLFYNFPFANTWLLEFNPIIWE